tara:strand:+ start:28156 stop:29535 length:1380 start_codon:yes stop_codon:yes gene_type:complete
MNKNLALDFLMSRPWALEQGYLDIMTGLSARDLDNLDLSSLKLSANQVAEGVATALEGKSGRAVTRGMEIRGDVAIIHVNGVISRYAGMFDDICGGTSTQNLAKDWTAATERHDVNSIVLYIDSPGGHADGIHEFAEMVYQGRGDKHVVAYVGGSACSAAYWIASAADEVVIDATGRAGSIGTVLNIRRRKATDSDPIETLEIVSSQSPNKRLDPFEKEGRDAYQSEMDQLADVFIDRVSRNMNVDRDTVLNDFGKGGVLVGQLAVDKGMAHRLGSLEGVVSELQNRKRKPMSKESKGPSAKGTTGASVIALNLPGAEAASVEQIVAAITAERPDVIAALVPAPEVTALESAEAIAAACASAGIPAMSASLLKPGVTKAAAEQQIKAATELKDTLAAAGLSASFDSLVSHVSDPVKLAGLVAHEIQAQGDESGNSSRQVIGDGGKTKASLNTKQIYANR